ncbi:MFS transporter [Urechidicola sp. KH5]
MSSLRIILSNKRYFAPASIFATLNILMGTWAIYIPTVKGTLQISDGDFGIALFCFGLGVLVMVLFAPKLIEKLEVGKATFYAVISLFITMLLPISAKSYTVLCVSLFMAGLSTGFLDIAMNALVSAIEKIDDIRIMAVNHGFFSLGGMIGAGIGILLMQYIPSGFYHMLLVAMLLLVLQLFMIKSYFSVKSEYEKGVKVGLKDLKPLIALIVVAFFVMGSEGAVEHWSALYLDKIVRTPEKFLGIGFTIFSFTMALFRFFGDSLSKKIGSYNLMVYGLVVAIFGLLLVIYASLVTTIFGFALIGVGFSVIVPELFRMASNTPSVSPEKGIAIISGIGFLGFLMFPFILGTISEVFTLKASFVALLVCSVIAFFIALFLKLK